MLLRVENLTGGYGKNFMLNNISFSLAEGDILCILGPNGCGKTTLLKLLLCFIMKNSGNIYVDGENISVMPRKTLAKLISYIPQKDSILFPYTNLEIVIMGRSSYLNSFQSPDKNDIDIAYEALKKLNISHLADKKFTEISGGERQLVLIARSLTQDAKILIMDEPTSSLDFGNQQLIMNTIKKLSHGGKTILFTTHSPQEPFLISTKILLLAEGKLIKFGKPKEVLTGETLEQAYKVPIDVVTVYDRNKNKRDICLIIQN